MIILNNHHQILILVRQLDVSNTRWCISISSVTYKDRQPWLARTADVLTDWMLLDEICDDSRNCLNDTGYESHVWSSFDGPWRTWSDTSVCAEGTWSCLTFMLWGIAMAFLVEALVLIVIGRSCSESCWFDSHNRPGSFLRFNYRPIMLSPYYATWNKGVRLLSMLKLWPIV